MAIYIFLLLRRHPANAIYRQTRHCTAVLVKLRGWFGSALVATSFTVRPLCVVAALESVSLFIIIASLPVIIVRHTPIKVESVGSVAVFVMTEVDIDGFVIVGTMFYVNKLIGSQFRFVS